MSEPASRTRDAERVDPEALHARIAALRDVAARVDPVRLQYLEALSARVAVQPERVRDLLCAKLAEAVAACEQRCAAQPAIVPRKKAPAVPNSPWAELNRSMGGGARAGAPSGARPAASDELPNARRFRRAWLGTRTQEQVRQAAGRKPANAGPLNSHALVLQSLDIMSRLSPDYLRRFVVHVQALQWLARAAQDDAPPARGAARGKKAPARGAGRK